jgi:hypothetical protein
MVGWFNPAQIFRIALQSSRAAGVISLVDEREIQSALAPPSLHDYSREQELWFDYVADLGDGFDSTYSVAFALAQESIGNGSAPAIALAGDVGTTLPRARILIMGGDEAYPAGSPENYQNRLVGPYRAALPFAEPPLHLFAIPGNHDWYDGLVAFRELFCQPGWIGAWRTQQTRSYFALALPHGWWLWATDIQLDRKIDAPQREFFLAAAQKLAAGDRVILCTAEPSWVQATLGETQPYESLSYLERNLIEPRGATLAVTLTGDRHNYARYSSAQQRHKINAGGGGAFLSGTHDLPDRIVLPKGDADAETVILQCAYPTRAKSRSIAWRTLGFIRKNPWFGGLMAVLYMLYGWLIQSASRSDLLAWPKARWPSLNPIPADSLLLWLRQAGTTFLETAGAGSSRETIHAFLAVLIRSPAVAAYSLLIIGTLVSFALSGVRRRDGSDHWKAIAVGVVHAALHLGFGLTLLILMARLNQKLAWPLSSLQSQTLLLLGMAVFGTAGGSLIMGIYLIITNRWLDLHDQEIFAAQANPNFKNFLRMHIDSSGRLHIYPLGIDKTCEWVLEPKGAPTAPWFRTKDGRPLALRLIESPLVIP